MSVQTVLDPINDLVEQAKRVLPGGSFGNMPAEVVIREGKGGRVWDEAGKRVCRLPAGLGADVRRPRPSRGDGGGAGADAARHDLLRQQPARHRAGRGDRRRGAVRRAGAVRLLGHRGRSLRDARRPRVPRRDKILKFEGGYHGMSDYALMSAGAEAARQFPAAGARLGRHPESRCATRCWSRRSTISRWCESLIDEHHDELAGVIVEPFQRLIPPKPGLPAGAARDHARARHSADLRRGRDRLPLRLRRRAGILRRDARSVHAGQDRSAAASRWRRSPAAPTSWRISTGGDGRRGFHLSQVGTLSGNPVAAVGGARDAGDPEAARRLRAGLRHRPRADGGARRAAEEGRHPGAGDRRAAAVRRRVHRPADQATIATR